MFQLRNRSGSRALPDANGQTPGVPGRGHDTRLVGLVAGLVGVAFVVALELAFEMPAAVPAMLLLVPVTTTSALSGWRYGVGLAIVAAISFAMFSVEPIGSPIVRIGADLLVLVTFLFVAFAVSYLINRRAWADRQLLDDQRVALLSGVSHDLRSPLTTIRAISSDLLVASDHYDDATRERMLERVVEESARLDRIVANLLSAVRIQEGALDPSTQPEQLSSLVDFSVRRLHRGHRDVKILVDVPHDLPDVEVDAVQLDQVVTNLLENAIRHGATEAPVEISAHWPSANAGTGFVEVAVVDQGLGFDQRALARLFKPFSSASESNGSTGLGLAVCRAVVEAHGGTIWLREHGGPGAQLAFTVPVAPGGEHPPRRR
jgi:K+-sensing histidine kinase KdpD